MLIQISSVSLLWIGWALLYFNWRYTDKVKTISYTTTNDNLSGRTVTWKEHKSGRKDGQKDLFKAKLEQQPVLFWYVSRCSWNVAVCRPNVCAQDSLDSEPEDGQCFSQRLLFSVSLLQYPRGLEQCSGKKQTRTNLLTDVFNE